MVTYTIHAGPVSSIFLPLSVNCRQRFQLNFWLLQFQKVQWHLQLRKSQKHHWKVGCAITAAFEISNDINLKEEPVNIFLIESDCFLISSFFLTFYLPIFCTRKSLSTIRDPTQCSSFTFYYINKKYDLENKLFTKTQTNDPLVCINICFRET